MAYSDKSYVAGRARADWRVVGSHRPLTIIRPGSSASWLTAFAQYRRILNERRPGAASNPVPGLDQDAVAQLGPHFEQDGIARRGADAVTRPEGAAVRRGTWRFTACGADTPSAKAPM